MIRRLPVAVYTCNKDGYIELYNKSAVELWGREPQIGKDKCCGSYKIFNIEGWQIPLDECPMAITIQQGIPVTGTEIFIERPDGERRFVLPHPLPVFDENGELTGAVNTLIDTTEMRISRQVMKEEEPSQYARSLIEASLDPLITISPEGKITDMNEALATITGETREKLIGTDFGNYFTDPQKARAVYQEVFTKGFVKNYPLTIIDGELTDVLFNGSVYKDEHGSVLGAVVVARVITEQKRIEKELIEAKVFAELATTIAVEEKSKAMQAVKIAEDAVKAKQQFLSNMSHEIRTPMNAIIGFTKVMLKTDLSARQKEYLTAIKMSGDSLIVLINDILDLAKAESGKMTFEQTPFKMELSLSAMLHLFETKIQEKNLELADSRFKCNSRGGGCEDKRRC